MSKKLTLEQFISKANQIHGEKYNYSQSFYTSAHTKLKIICKIHGVFEQIPRDHLRGHGCVVCGFEKTQKSLSFQLADFINKSNLIHNKFYLYDRSVYKNASAKIEIGCPTHGYFWQIAMNHMTGQGCNKCARIKTGQKLVRSMEEFVFLANQIHNNKYNYKFVVYKNSFQRITITCPKHGKFNQLPYIHLAGFGCPACKESLGEKQISNLLLKYNCNFKTQIRFSDCRDILPLSFDFGIYGTDQKLKGLLEYQGIQHYKVIDYFGGKKAFDSYIKRDAIKKSYCQQNNIPLLIIPYDQRKTIDKQINNFLLNILRD